MSQYSPSRGSITGDLTFLTANSSVNATTSLTFKLGGTDIVRINSSGFSILGGNLLYNNANFSLLASTSDASDSQGAWLCGGGANTTSRGAVILLAGNERSGSNGLLTLSAGDASSAYVGITAPAATAPTIRFTLTATEQWRMNQNYFTGYDSASSNIARVNDTGEMYISGGSGAGAPATGAYALFKGATAGVSPGLVVFASGSNSGAYCQYEAWHASGTHRFRIGGTEQLRLETGFVFSNMVAGNESTGAGTALLGTNCPAVTVSAPFKWLKIKTQDGSTAYIPVWK
jgi:hypothetical protein